MIINALVGGTPGKDCGGSFCKFCYFKSFNYDYLDNNLLGCKFCPTDHIGCSNCHGFFNEIENGFKPISQVLSQLRTTLSWHEFFGTFNYDNFQIITMSAADILFYPQLTELVSTIKDWGLKVNMGYTSGKGVNDQKMIDGLISTGVNGINFSVLSSNPELRRKWMGDKSPEQSLKALKTFCENMEVVASTVVIPDVIDQEDIFKTCSMLEDWGIKSFILSRFVNFKNEGLIYNHSPVINGMKTQPFEEFQKLVKKVDEEFSFKVIGSPEILYELSKKENRKFLKKLPEVKAEATIITSKLSYNDLNNIFDVIAKDLVNVVAVDKEIGSLITCEDLENLNLDEVKKNVIIPGGALVHDNTASVILNKDGIKRSVVRGPGSLFFLDFELSSNVDVLEYEIRAFKDLINKINSFLS